MCTFSMVADQFRKDHQTFPGWPNMIPPNDPVQFPLFPVGQSHDHLATKEEVAELREDLESLKKLLKAAAIYDEETGQAECEQEEKIVLIRRLAEICDVDMEDCLPDAPVLHHRV